MNEEEKLVLKNSWNRTIQPIHKIGFRDGVSDGEAAEFQASFNMGYSQGLSLGITLGFKIGMSLTTKVESPVVLIDTHKINCQICVGSQTLENVVNLYTKQQEKNMLLIDKYLNNK